MGTLGAVPAASFFDTAEKEGEKGSSRASFANEVGITSGMGYTRAATGFQVINNPCLYQWHQHLLGIPGHQHLPGVKWSLTILRLYQVINNPSFIPGHQRFLVYTREKQAIHTSGRAVGGGRFFGLYTPEERFLGHLRVWRLGELDPRLWDDSGQRVSSNRPVSGMSTMVGGHSARCKAAASGRAASISSRVSGRAACGSG